MADRPSDHERELEERIRRLEAENSAQKKELAEAEQQKKRLAALDAENKKLQAKIDDLKTRLASALRTSRTSSRRPSSDIVKPRRERRASGRKSGAQPGHPQHERTPFAPVNLDKTLCYKLHSCPDCGGPLKDSTSLLPSVVQQVEITAVPVEITEHRAGWYWCEKCQKLHCPLPAAVEKSGLCGPLLTAWIAYLKGGCHASFSSIRKFLRDVLGVQLSRGVLAKVIAKVSAALAEPWEELRQLLPLAQRLNVDETGHKENGQTFWTWCFRAREYTLFKIAETRGTAVLLETLGADFAGIIGCDYFSSYRCYMGEFGGVLQFCLAHLIREVKFLLELPDAATRAYGERFLQSLRELFGVIHRRQRLTAGKFRGALEAQRRKIIRAALKQVPASTAAQNLARRMRKHGASYFRFISTPGLEPTNNLAEQAIRFVVIDRHVTQGTRSEKGRQWCERIWTVLATCQQRGRSAFHFIRDAVQAYLTGTPAPSLLAASP
jgi:transposase